MSKLTHFNTKGEAHMVDVGAKAVTHRRAITEGEILRIDGNKLTTLFENNNEAGYKILKKLYASLYERIQNSNFMLRNYLI